ncbi:MAG: hypothetical protein H0X33_07090 [Taibaiella sp.]|nr:hypothetical protein [Taibaiella sp.]
MLSEVKIWILLAAVSAMAAIIGFTIKVLTSQVINRLDEIVNELKQLTRNSAIQEQQIKDMQEQNRMIHQRLNDHSGRIRTVEMKYDR